MNATSTSTNDRPRTCIGQERDVRQLEHPAE